MKSQKKLTELVHYPMLDLMRITHALIGNCVK